MGTKWFPGSRAEQLNMCRVWIAVMTEEVRTAWGIPAARFTELNALFAAAQAALQTATTETTRTPVATAACKTAFKVMEAKMRFFKNHYFLVPPLTDADLVSLGLKPPAGASSPIPAPDAEATGDIGYPDPHVIDILNLRPRQHHSTDPRSDYGFAIKMGIVGGTEHYHIDAPPPSDKGITLPFYMSTRRRRERFDLAGNSGKILCISIAWKNSKGEEGPYCPVMQIIIP